MQHEREESTGRQSPLSVSNPLSVAILAESFPCVSETFVVGHVRALARRGVDVRVIARRAVAGIRHVAERDPELMKLVYRPRFKTRRLPGPLAAADLLGYAAARMRRRYDIIHAHFGPVGLRALALKRGRLIRGRLVVTFHAHDLGAVPRMRGRDVYNALFNAADLLLPVSEHGRRRLLDLGAPVEKIQVHHMGVDLEGLPFRPRTRTHASRLVTVARLVPKKGVGTALEATARLIAEGRAVEHLVIGDGPQRASLARLAADLGIGRAVTFTGSLVPSDVLAHVLSSHLMVLPSTVSSDGDEEGIPVSLMEALATGLPVVATAHAGIPELVDESCGRLVPSDDSAALASAIAEVLDHPEEWSRMASLGRQRVERSFALDSLTDELIEIYRGLAEA